MHRLITHPMISALLGILLLVTAIPSAVAQDHSGFAGRVNGLDHLEGFFDLYWDKEKGQLLLRIDSFDKDFIYQSSMSRGVGSNDLGLDRGQLGLTRLVSFFRSGPKVLMIENNMGYRASTSNAAELAAVENSFARSVKLPLLSLIQSWFGDA